MAQLWKEFLAPYPIEQVEKFFKGWIGRSKFMPSISEARTELDAMGVPEYQGFTEEEKRLADEAKDSPEAKAFQQTVKNIVDGKRMPEKAKSDHAAKVRKQAEKMR